MMTCLLCTSKLDLNNPEDKLWRILVEYIFPSLIPQISDDAGVCEDCSNKLSKIKLFKQRCLDIEKKINAHRTHSGSQMVNPKEMCASDNRDCDVGQMEAVICRLCFQVTDQNISAYLDFQYAMIIGVVLPEMNLDSVKQPMMCQDCTRFLDKMDHLHKSLLQSTEIAKLHNKRVGGCDFENDPLPLNVKCEWVEGTSSLLYDETETPLSRPPEDPEFDTVTAEHYPDMTTSVQNAGTITTERNDPRFTENLDDADAVKEEIDENTFEANNPQDSPTNDNKIFVTKWSNSSNLFKRNKTTKLFHCPRCSYSSKWQQDFKRHFFIKHDADYVPFQCTTCGYQTKRKTELTRHVRTEHDTDFTPFECSHCKYSTKWKSSLRRHVRLEHDQDVKLFDCALCSYTSKQKSSLKQHMATNHEENRIIFECPQCPFKTKSESYLKHHIRCHGTATSVHECTQCKFKTRWKQYLMKHVRLKHGTNRKIYRCAHCEYSSNLRGSIIQHIRNIHRKAIYECPHCKYKTKCRLIFERHVKLTHERDSLTFQCTSCKFKTDRHTSLRRHIECRHNRKPVPFECTVCKQKMKTKQSLKEHIEMVHSTSIEMVQCTHCQFKTKWKKGLERHFRLKHDVNCEVFRCDFCSYQTKLRANLKLHVNSKHSDCRMLYQCGFCETKTVSETYLKRHVKTEHGGKGAVKKEEV